MRLRMVTLAAGPAGVWRAGQPVDVPDTVAVAMVDGGYAVAMMRRSETAMVRPAESGDRPIPTSAPGSDDDFTLIKGIGVAMAGRLRARQIRTFQDLADADASQISTIHGASLRQVQGWIDQAREMVG